MERATRTLGANLKDIAADALETGAGDLEFNDGAIRIVGTDRTVSFADLAKRAGSDPSKLSASATFGSADGTYPNGTHVVEVEIDPATGVIHVVNYVIVDDFGVTLNPLLLEGQVHGGTMQGIGQALMEQAVYDSTDGQLMTGTFMDYALPRAGGPSIKFETHNVPCTTNPLGVKGAGEAGAIASCPAVVNAIIDGLSREYGIDHIDMPATGQPRQNGSGWQSNEAVASIDYKNSRGRKKLLSLPDGSRDAGFGQALGEDASLKTEGRKSNEAFDPRRRGIAGWCQRRSCPARHRRCSRIT